MATQALVANGAKVYITGRTKEKLDTVAEKYSEGSGSIIPIQCDVSDKAQIASLVKEISSKEECLCILINNAGISGNTFQTEAESATEMKANLFDDSKATFEDWTDVYRTNVPQLFFMTTAFLPLLQKSTDRHRHQRGLDQRAGQDGAAPLRVQRVEGGGDPPNAHARDRDREQQPLADPRQLDRAGRLPQRDDGGRERWRPEEPDREGEVRREGAGAAPRQGRGYGADGALLRGEPVLEWSDGGGGWWIYYCRGRVDTVHVRFV